jgi:hypothetical protein
MIWPLLKRILPIVFVAIYLLSPVDLLPDFLLGAGWIDDFILLGLLIWLLSGRTIPLFARFGSPYGRKRTSQGSADSSRARDHDSPHDPDPYAVLGLKAGATEEEIKEAYRLAVAKYHPDKVSHLGKEFQELAHRKFVAIQEAYEHLTKAR